MQSECTKGRFSEAFLPSLFLLSQSAELSLVLLNANCAVAVGWRAERRREEEKVQLIITVPVVVSTRFHSLN